MNRASGRQSSVLSYDSKSIDHSADSNPVVETG